MENHHSILNTQMEKQFRPFPTSSSRLILRKWRKQEPTILLPFKIDIVVIDEKNKCCIQKIFSSLLPMSSEVQKIGCNTNHLIYLVIIIHENPKFLNIDCEIQLDLCTFLLHGEQRIRLSWI